ncbi:hypothetical protein ACRDNQ_15685 [Palleronia sp. KMU-117]|uniref:hypothetical protein n=1 Tax=Palleronia sp. KMU-117 TaxID=3434108 RepID=UPI003D75933F
MIGLFFKDRTAALRQRHEGGDQAGSTMPGRVDRSAAGLAEASQRMRRRCEDDLAYFLAARRSGGARLA